MPEPKELMNMEVEDNANEMVDFKNEAVSIWFLCGDCSGKFHVYRKLLEFFWFDVANLQKRTCYKEFKEI